MKVLVTGYAGQLGWDTVHQLEARGIEARGVDIQDFSLSDAPAVTVAAAIPLIALCTFLSSALIIKVLSLIPGSRWLIG